jgi:hypothetical protein
VGLGGFFILIGGLSAMAWTRFRRYDDEQLATLINPEGKLPSMLDDQAVDLGDTGMEGAAAHEKVSGGGLGVGGSRVVPASVAAAAAAAAAGSDAESEQQQKAPAPAIAATQVKAPLVPQAPNGAPADVPPADVPPADVPAAPAPAPAPIKAPIVVAQPANGAHVPNGDHEEAAPTPAPAPAPAPQPVPVAATPATNGAETHPPPYGNEVDTELQRILREAGVDSQVESILSDARTEAARQGVTVDSDQMMRALADEAKESPSLTRRTRDKLEHRLQRIAEERRGSRSGGER